MAVRLRGAPTRVSSAGRDPASAASLLENAGRAGADFALECRYSGSGSRMSLQLKLVRGSSRLMTAAVDRKGRVDLVLDTVILDALDELLNRVRPRIQEVVAAYRPPAPVSPAAVGPGPSIGLPGSSVSGPGSSTGLPGPSGSAASATTTATAGSLGAPGSARGPGPHPPRARGRMHQARRPADSQADSPACCRGAESPIPAGRTKAPAC